MSGQLRDRTGAAVRLRGVNWYGAESPDFVVAGLHRQPLARIAASIAALGANVVRLPWSLALVADTPPVPAFAVAAEPCLQGASALAALDATIATLTAAGLALILDCHLDRADWCCADDHDPLPHLTADQEQRWIAAWVTLVRRYRTTPLVIAADLWNEPRGRARWGRGGQAHDWPAAAERAAAAILQEHPDLLIIVEGVDYAADLRGVRQRPVHLPLPGRLVYSVHDYPWFHRQLAPAALRQRWKERWGFLARGEVPLLVGEFGLASDAWPAGPVAGWLRTFLDYLDELGASWTYWPLNGTMASASARWGRRFGAREPFGLLDERWEWPANPGLVEVLFRSPRPS
ncbi:MAG: hypothetical protein KatS3mg061_3536 [Dehalococcoidia bacterium]|nr:MAG: hypothetical protein KatS3mg061_3536 [Dehalococcoidia bacterium]